MRTLFTPYPTATPQLNPPEDYQHIGSSPEMFGGIPAAAEQRGGAELTQSGGEMISAGINTANLYGELAAQQANSAFVDRTNRILFGDPDKPGDVGYYGMHGQDAMSNRQATLQAIDQARQQSVSSLPTARAQILFQNEARYYTARLQTEIGAHYDQESRVWANTVQDQQFHSAAAGGALRYNNDDALTDSIGVATSALVKKAQNSGVLPLDPTQMTDQQRSVMSNLQRQGEVAVVESAIKSAIGRNDMGRAQQLLAAHRDALSTAPNFDQLNREVTTGGAVTLGNQMLQDAQGNAATAPTSGGAPSLTPADDPRHMIPVITAAAKKYGVDPNIALRVAKSEGLGEFSGDSGTSFGAFQLHTGGGLGDEFRRDTGLDPSDPKNEAATIDYAMSRVHETGWTPFHGAARVGIAPREGIAAAPAKIDLSVGDSIAVGQGGTAATARVGDNPQQVLTRIDALAPQSVSGRTVFLSTGASNNPDQVGLAADQILALKKAGAAAILVPGVGPGVRNADEVNAELSNIAKANGATFFQPDVKWAADGIHPADANAVREQGLTALAQHGAPDQMMPPSVADNQPGTPPTPAVIPPPGMEGLAQAETELAQQHATLIEHLTNDPRGAQNPAALAHAVAQADTVFRAKQMAITAERQALLTKRSVAADGFVKQIITGNADPQIVQQIAGSPDLDAGTRENLTRLYQTTAAKTSAGDLAKYGPQFFDVLQRVTAPDSDPNKIRDPSQLIALAVPGADGSQALTVAGVDKLNAELRASQQPEKVGEQRMRQGALDYAKHQLSFEADYGLYKIPDPKGMDAFNVGFLPAFYHYYEAGIAQGKTPQELLAKDKLDALIQPFKRSPAQYQTDYLGAEATTPGSATQADPMAALQAAKDPAIGLPALRAAVLAHKMSPEDAVTYATKHNWLAPAVPNAP